MHFSYRKCSSTASHSLTYNEHSDVCKIPDIVLYKSRIYIGHINNMTQNFRYLGIYSIFFISFLLRLVLLSSIPLLLLLVLCCCKQHSFLLYSHFSLCRGPVAKNALIKCELSQCCSNFSSQAHFVCLHILKEKIEEKNKMKTKQKGKRNEMRKMYGNDAKPCAIT